MSLAVAAAMEWLKENAPRAAKNAGTKSSMLKAIAAKYDERKLKSERGEKEQLSARMVERHPEVVRGKIPP